MSFPAEGVESKFRNDIEEVATMLNKYHDGHYSIFNLSERAYNTQKFSNMVEHIPFPDHHPPPLSLLMFTCHKIDCWLRADPLNVVVIHCLAGKGRTGTVIAAYFVFCGLFSEAVEAMNYYAHKRSINNWGVTGPSQRRYVEYLADIISLDWAPLFSPLILKQIIIEDMIAVDSEAITPPFFVLYDVNDAMKPIKLYDSKSYDIGTQTFVTMKWNVGVLVQGDLLLHMMHIPSKLLGFREMLLGRVSFHTGMISSYTQSFALRDLDDVSDETHLPPTFRLVLEFEPCTEEQLRRFEEENATKKDFETAIWEMRSFEPRNGTICFADNGAAFEKVVEARDVSSVSYGNYSEKGGWLVKQGGEYKTWKKRWFVIKGDRISYFKGPRNLQSLGEIFMIEVKNVAASQTVDRLFRLTTSRREFVLVADSKFERDQWVKAIEKALANCMSLPSPSLDLEKLLGSLYVSLFDVKLSKSAIERAQRIQHNYFAGSSSIRTPANWSPSKAAYLNVFCELEYEHYKLKSSPIKVKVDPQKANNSVYYSVRCADGAKHQSMEQLFKFLIFDLSSPLIIRLLFSPLLSKRTVFNDHTNPQPNPNTNPTAHVLGEMSIDIQNGRTSDGAEREYVLTEPSSSLYEDTSTDQNQPPQKEGNCQSLLISFDDVFSPPTPVESPSTVQMKVVFLPSQCLSPVSSKSPKDPTVGLSSTPNFFTDSTLLLGDLPLVDAQPTTTATLLKDLSSSPFKNGNVLILQSVESSFAVKILELTRRLDAADCAENGTQFTVTTRGNDRITFQDPDKQYLRLNNRQQADCMGQGDLSCEFYVHEHPSRHRSHVLYSFESVAFPGCFLGFDDAGRLLPPDVVGFGSASQFNVLVWGDYGSANRFMTDLYSIFN